MKNTLSLKLLSGALATAALITALPGCAPIVLGGAAVMTGMMATDRRSAGTQEIGRAHV